MTIRLRPATPLDAESMARLVNLAGEGMPAALWGDLAAPGQSAMDVGMERARRNEGRFSLPNAQIAELHGEVAGIITSHEIGTEKEEITGDTHPMFRPLIKLRSCALQTRYISALAVFPKFCRQGVATAMIEEAEARAGKKGVSLVTTEANTDAKAFYTAMGYRDAAAAPVIRANWKTDSRFWHLLRKP